MPRSRRSSLRMQKLTTILAVIDPAAQPQQVLGKALALARYFGARIELFLCDAEHAYMLGRAYDTAGVDRAHALCVEEGRRYLGHLGHDCGVTDVAINVDVACESPLYESIVRKAQECAADLVIKAASGDHPMRRFCLGANDWQLARTCPATLMLVRGRTWAPLPRFAAAVDVSDSETAGLALGVMRTAEYLSLGCHAELELLYSAVDIEDAEAYGHRLTKLSQLAEEFHVGRDHVHALQGAPEQRLPAFAAARGYDVLVMGALTHRKGITSLIGTLTSHLVDALDCDFVLVKPEGFCSPLRPSEADFDGARC